MGTVLQRKLESWHTIYPAGRKFCSMCGRWRLVSDYSVRQWVDEEKTVPHTFCSICIPCNRLSRRERTGQKPNQWYKYGMPGSEQYIQRRRANNSASQARRMKDPEYRAQNNEYWRFWSRRHKGTPEVSELPDSSKSEKIMVDPSPYLEWANQVKPRLTDTESRSIARYRSGVNNGVEIGVIDSVMTRYGASDQFVILYPLEEEEAA